ncbi:hypothetical protein ACIBFB_05340 [Nocardiopsis sp. NPDC050513]|uniref:hypothetical protein n=1 Tax=Nocardiopsis sp. NPDC050513 TaxID=3364338 RepID=UPI0037BAFF7D
MNNRVTLSATALMLCVAGCGLVDKPLESAVADCGLDEAPGAVLGDDGHSLRLDGRGEEDQIGLDFADIQCVLDELDTPDYVMNRILQTRALDGTQAGSWDDFHATWSYHPNSGTSMTISPLEG